MRLIWKFFAIVPLLIADSPKAQEAVVSEVTPLFASDSLIDVTLDGPIRTIVRSAERSTDVHPAMLASAGESHAIELSARGISRRKRANCKFPPLRVKFTGEKAKTSLFAKQGSIKLVTHCDDKDLAEQTVLREYAAYRLYNLVTPKSHKVRLARVRYLDGGSEVANRLGFFIEDTDDLARRVGLKEADIIKISPRWTVFDEAARYSLFQYMIGNTDWSMINGPDPNDCCHNSKLIGSAKDAARDLVPVPYDFDNSGLVDAPYALPSDKLKIRKVTQRVYRGFCMHNDAVLAELPAFRAMRAQFDAELAALPLVSEKSRSNMRSYLAGFFEDIATDEAAQKNLLKDCL